MNRSVAPTTIAPPAARYSHAVLSVGAERLLHTSGVVPIAPDGQVPEGLAEQAETVWASLGAILARSGSGWRTPASMSRSSVSAATEVTGSSRVAETPTRRSASACRAGYSSFTATRTRITMTSR